MQVGTVSRENALTTCPNITLRHDRGYPQGRGRKSRIIINCRTSRLPPLPAAALVGLPIGDLEPPRLAGGPVFARGGERVGIVAVEHQNQTLVAVAVGRQARIVDQEADIGPVRITLLDREDD